MKGYAHPGSIRMLCLFLSVILAAAILMSPVLADAPAFGYETVEEARVRALNCLMRCGFSQEYNADGTMFGGHGLIRWTDTVWIYVSGSPGEEDLRQLDLFIMEVATHCPDMPNIRRTAEPDQANLVIHYCPFDEMRDTIEYYVEGNLGFFCYWCDESGSIYKGEICIATDLNTTESKNHLLREELLGALGLTNDHYDYSDSILYGEWTTTQQLSDVDWLMLNMLYDKDLPLLASPAEAYEFLLDKIYR